MIYFSNFNFVINVDKALKEKDDYIRIAVIFLRLSVI